MVDEEKIREQNICEDKHRDVSEFIHQLERRLDKLESELGDLEEDDDEYELLESEFSKTIKELEKAYVEQNELEDKLNRFGSKLATR
jgi:hypothetical protein